MLTLLLIHPARTTRSCSVREVFPNGGASIFTFDIKGGKEAAFKFIDKLQIFSLLANVADVKSLVIHPATTTHSQLTAEELEDQGIHQGTIVCPLAPRISTIFWLTSSRHSTKLNIAYSYFTSYDLTRKDPLKAGLFLSVQQFHPSMMAKLSAILSTGIIPLFGLQFI